MRIKKILLNTISILLVFAIFYFLVKELFHNWTAIRSYPLTFNIPLLLLSSLLYAATCTILGFGWYLILRYLHHPLSLFHAIFYFFITFPSRYIPGKIWIALTRMKFCKPKGIPHSITFLSTGIEVVMEILSGTYISFIALLQTPLLGRFSFWGTIAVTLAGLMLLIPDVFYFFINLYLKIVKRETIQKNERVSFLKLCLLQLTYIFGMAGWGVSQVVFLLSFTPVSASDLPFLISIGAFSYVASIAAVFSPSGLGVREGIWYIALKTLTAPHIALVYSFLSRIWSILVEAMLLFISLPILLIRKRREEKLSDI